MLLSFSASRKARSERRQRLDVGVVQRVEEGTERVLLPFFPGEASFDVDGEDDRLAGEVGDEDGAIEPAARQDGDAFHRRHEPRIGEWKKLVKALPIIHTRAVC